MAWDKFYRILVKTRGNISKANPDELRKAALANLESGPTKAFNVAWEYYLQDLRRGEFRINL